MKRINTLQTQILVILLRKDYLRSSEIYNLLLTDNTKTSLISVKRSISEMASLELVKVHGAGRSTSYQISNAGRVFTAINATDYVGIEPDRRFGLETYNFSLFSDFPSDLLEARELQELQDATTTYQKRVEGTSDVIKEKELQRLVIELAWKSSKIEGNTYTLLDTEKLILEEKEAQGHDKNEAKMILNHKDAFNYVRCNAKSYKGLTLRNLEKLHSILMHDLGVETGLRNIQVGVTGSRYKPLDNVYQIREAVEGLSGAIDRAGDPYTKALLVLLGVSYIQPFEDGNKRTGRLMANAILLSYGCAPLSYRSVDEIDYRNAVLTFYELNSVMPFKDIFIEQYLFAAKNYAVS